MAPTIPLATYRLQFTKDFTFDDAAALAPYLKEIGISHLYASPFLKARPGSAHGYDIVDHDSFNPELGGEAGFARMSDALKKNGLGLILDLVPNHMGVGHSDNAWWLDVLEWGPKSPHASAFDIDWEGLPYRRHPGVLLPVLGRAYGEALQSGEISLKYDPGAGTFAAWYFDHKFPINPQRYGEILRTLVGAAGAADELAGQKIITLAQNYRDTGTPSYRDAPELKLRLSQIDGAPALIERGLGAYGGGSETGTLALHRLLERQYYRLAYWRIAFSAVNYRRFFDISDLAGLRVEDSTTFRAIHPLVARLISEDRLQGLRLDHIDGLRDPAQYTRRLQQLIAKLRRTAGLRGSFYVIVEKILGENEKMPRLPGVVGTTGYEWLNVISRVLIDGNGLAPLETTWRDFTGERARFAAMLKAAKLRVIDTMLASEFTVLTRALARIAAGHFNTRDITIDRLRAALQSYVLEFPVYRTYVTAAGASPSDRAQIEAAIARARALWQGPDPEVFDFLRDAISLDLGTNSGYSAARVRNFALKLQQFTGPLMAKSLEDTTFYRYQPLLALNEVGGDPIAGALALDDFHAGQQVRTEVAPHGLTATATHDTKRGEDARARILALSELAGEWGTAVREWQNMNAHFPRSSGSRRLPSASHEYMLYQALIGAWPARIDDVFIDRMLAYTVKAAREGKEETNWTNPDEAYEKALQDFVRDILASDGAATFRASFDHFARRTALLGALNGLSQLALKTLLPGIPDFYQGTEFWDLALVDPDNRRPVDFAARLKELDGSQPNWTALVAQWADGRIKFAALRELLRVRQNYAGLFANGTYEPIAVTGPHASHVVAFTRTWKREQILVAVVRHFASLTDGGQRWPDAIDAVIPTVVSSTYTSLMGPERGQLVGEIDLSKLFFAVPFGIYRLGKQ